MDKEQTYLYEYGASLWFTVTSFVFIEVAGIVSVYYYLAQQRHRLRVRNNAAIAAEASNSKLLRSKTTTSYLGNAGDSSYSDASTAHARPKSRGASLTLPRHMSTDGPRDDDNNVAAGALSPTADHAAILTGNHHATMPPPPHYNVVTGGMPFGTAAAASIAADCQSACNCYQTLSDIYPPHGNTVLRVELPTNYRQPHQLRKTTPV